VEGFGAWKAGQVCDQGRCCWNWLDYMSLTAAWRILIYVSVCVGSDQGVEFGVRGVRGNGKRGWEGWEGWVDGRDG
jgi:hypothetical protein